MPKKRLDVNWKREIGKEDLKPAVQRFKRYLEDKGLRASTIPMYVLRASKYLEFSETDSPNADDFARFRDHLHDKKLSRSTVNNYCFSIKKYHEMLGQDVSFTFIKPNNIIPYYFDESEITKIFSISHPCPLLGFRRIHRDEMTRSSYWKGNKLCLSTHRRWSPTRDHSSTQLDCKRRYRWGKLPGRCNSRLDMCM